MSKRKILGPFPERGPWGGLIASLLVLWLIAGCSVPPKSDEELRKEIQELKAEVKVLQEKLGQVQAGQQALLELLKPPPAPQSAAPAPVPPAPLAPSAPQPLTVSQLLAAKDRYLGTRVTVRGPVGPVLVHHKSLLLKAPEGMVEVRFGKLPDQKLVNQLTSITIEKPVTVTGVVSLSPQGGAGARLQIDADSIEF